MGRIDHGATGPKSSSKRRTAPWGIGLLLLLFVFWKQIGGLGGLIPGSGSGSDAGNRGNPRAMPARYDSTARPRIAEQLGLVSSPKSTRPAPVPSAGTADAKVSVGNAAGAEKVTVRFGTAGAGAPIQGHVEILQPSAESRPESAPARFEIRDGTATLATLRPGETARVRVVTTGRPALIGTLDAKDGALVDLEEEARITGRAGFGEGVPAVNADLVAMVFRAARDPERIPFRTGPDGAFAITTAGGRDVLVEIRTTDVGGGADRAAFVEHRPLLDGSAPWVLAPVTFERAEILARGNVAGGDGNPAGGATVLVLPVDLPARALSARSEPDGSFVVKGPPCQGPLEVFAITEDQAARATGMIAKGATANIRLGPAGSVSGRVAAATPAIHPLLRIELRTEPGNLYATAVVARDGTFAFPLVPAGRYALVVAAADRKSAPSAPVDVAAGGAAADPLLAALPVATGLSAATLRVIDGSGAPIGGASVDVAVTPAATLHGVSDAAGNVEVVVPHGGAQIVVAASGWRTHRGPWDGATPVTLVP